VLTQALARITVDESISGTFSIYNLVFLTSIKPLTQLLGRAIAIVPEGAVDIGDDIDDGYGGTQLVELMALRKEAGDFLHS
jgi:hypothetical protein